MRYLIVFCFLLCGCAHDMIGVDRKTGERITIHYRDNLAYEEISTTIDDETFRGKLIPASTTYAGQDRVIVNSYRSVLLGDKNHTIRCEIVSGGFLGGGAGSCITSDGREFDVQW